MSVQLPTGWKLISKKRHLFKDRSKYAFKGEVVHILHVKCQFCGTEKRLNSRYVTVDALLTHESYPDGPICTLIPGYRDWESEHEVLKQEVTSLSSQKEELEKELTHKTRLYNDLLVNAPRIFGAPSTSNSEDKLKVKRLLLQTHPDKNDGKSFSAAEVTAMLTTLL